MNMELTIDRPGEWERISDRHTVLIEPPQANKAFYLGHVLAGNVRVSFLGVEWIANPNYFKELR